MSLSSFHIWGNKMENYWLEEYIALREQYDKLFEKYKSYVECSLDRENKWKDLSCIPEVGEVELQYDNVGMPTAWRWKMPF